MQQYLLCVIFFYFSELWGPICFNVHMRDQRPSVVHISLRSAPVDIQSHGSMVRCHAFDSKTKAALEAWDTRRGSWTVFHTYTESGSYWYWYVWYCCRSLSSCFLRRSRASIYHIPRFAQSSTYRYVFWRHTYSRAYAVGFLRIPYPRDSQARYTGMARAYFRDIWVVWDGLLGFKKVHGLQWASLIVARHWQARRAWIY